MSETATPAAAPAVTAPPVKELTPEEKQEKLELRKRTRDRVAKEIVSTEDTYVKNLNLLVELYIIPLTKNDDVISPKDAPKLFSNLGVIAGLNTKFLADLEKRISTWEENDKIGDLFIAFSPFFKMYTTYVSNHDVATQFLEKLGESSRFTAYCAKVMADPRMKGTPLASFLIMPIQRIPRYELLLRELIRNTESNHADYESLTKALGLVSEVAKHVNEAIRSQQNRVTVLNIQKEFNNSELHLVTPSRVFIRKGPLTKRCRNSDKEYIFFLFNDLLLYASKVAGKYKLHKQIDINGQFFIQDLPDEEKSSNRFQIVNTKKSFVVYTADKAVKAEWLVDFYKCIVANKKAINKEKTLHEIVAPVWQHDQSSTKCTCCDKSFGIFRRRHHCRYCGSLVCDPCSTKRMVLSSTKGKTEPQRICDKCVQNIGERQAVATKAQNQMMLNAIAPVKKKDEKVGGHRVTPSTAIGIDTTAVNKPEDPESDDDAATAGADGDATIIAGPKLGTSGPPPLSAMVAEKVTFNDPNGMPAIDESGQTSGTLAPSTWSSLSTTSPFGAVKARGTSFAGSSSSGAAGTAGAAGASADGALPAQVHEPHTALYNFSSAEVGDLSFVAGDTLVVTRKSDTPGWYYGTHDKTHAAGAFPSNYVEPTSANGGSANGSGSASDQTSVDLMMQVTADRAPTADNEMAVKKGDRVHVTTRDGQGWYYGENHTRGNAGGWLPASICKEIDRNAPAAKPATAPAAAAVTSPVSAAGGSGKKPVPVTKPNIGSATLKAAISGTTTPTAATASTPTKAGAVTANKFATMPKPVTSPAASTGATPAAATAAAGATKRPPLPALPPTPGGTAASPKPATSPTTPAFGTAPARPALPANKPAVTSPTASTASGRPALPPAPTAGATAAGVAAPTAVGSGSGGVKALASKWK